MTAPEDDRPVGEVPPRFLYRDPTKPDPYQALLTQLHEARAEVSEWRRRHEEVCVRLDEAGAQAIEMHSREAALRAGIERLVPCADLLLAAEASWGGWAHNYAKLGHSLRALLDGEVRP